MKSKFPQFFHKPNAILTSLLNKTVLSTVYNGAIFMNKDCPKCGGLFFFGGAIGSLDKLYLFTSLNSLEVHHLGLTNKAHQVSIMKECIQFLNLSCYYFSTNLISRSDFGHNLEKNYVTKWDKVNI